MSDPNERDSKLVQYMNDAYAKERELESALLGQIESAIKAPHKKRLKKLLKETKAHTKTLERRIRKLGGKDALKDVAPKKPRAVKGGEQEQKLGATASQYVGAHEKISTYLSLETFATKVGDSETAKLARDIRRDVERMAKSLEGQIKSLSNAVAVEVVPARLRRSKAKPKSRRRAAKKAAPAKAPKAATKSAPASKAKSAGTKSSGKAGAKPKAASRASTTAKRKSSKKAGTGK
jgi:ferritin-like metal-binding protein YciE